MRPVGWRWPLALSACVILGQLFSLAPLVDIISGTSPADLRLAYPLTYVALGPFTLLADFLNGSPARELKGFAVWLVAGFAAVRIARRPRTPLSIAARVGREILAFALLLAALAAFVAWGVLGPRPVARLANADPDVLVYDIHSHTAASHDGRPGFGAAGNAAWHARAGFDAAFVTDHNTGAAIRTWLTDGARAETRLLPGNELSLSGLHLLVLGSAEDVPNEPARGSWQATGALLRGLAAAPAGDSASATPFRVASLPEYWRYRWGADQDSLVSWGVGGFEVWTTSPRAMDFPAALRREIVARCRREGLVMFGATDMHGLGASASVWNVVRMPGWQGMDARTLSAALAAHWRQGGAEANRVIVRRRWIPDGAAQAAVAIPVNVVVVLRTAAPAHAIALLIWAWLPALLISARRRAAPRP